MVVVSKKKELLKAISNNENEIIVKGKLAKKISILEKLKKENDCSKIRESMGAFRAVSTVGTLGVSTVVAITLIVTVGVVSIVAILKDYSIKVKKGEGNEFEVILDK